MKFKDYILLREIDEKNGSPDHASGIHTTLSLGKDNDFKPFVIADDNRNPAYPSNKNLAPIVRAFTNSKKTRVYDSMGKDGSPKPHTLPQKSLYMVGGAVRDHLLGKTPHDIDLATDATPDEIRMILSDNGFKELEKDRSSGGSSGRVFYVKGKDKAGSDFVFGIKVNGQEFELATFRKDSHGSDGRFPDKMSFGGHKDDAARRDLTMNSMYILLGNPDGPNNQLTDFHSGIHDLRNGNVRFVGKAEDRLEEDMLRALRYARFTARFGNGNIDPQIEAKIRHIAPKISAVISPDRIQQEFIKGLEDKDTDPSKLIQIYKKLGLFDVVFPGMHVNDTDVPKTKDRAVILASLLRGNHESGIQQMLHQGKWKNEDITRVGFLHKLLQLNPMSSAAEIDNHLNGHNRAGIMGKSIQDWWAANKKENGVLDAFLDFANGPRVKAITVDESGGNMIDPDFAQFFDPIHGKPLPEMGPHIGELKKKKEHQNFLDILRKHSS